MTPAEFREWGHRLIDWVADYLQNPSRYPVLSQVSPGAIKASLPKNPPMSPEPMEEIFRDLERCIVPGLTHWNHPSFFAFFPSTGSGPGILGELLSAAFNVNGMLWHTSPAATELEEVVLDWLRQMIGLPSEFEGFVYDSATVGTFHAIATARQAVRLRDFRKEGSSGPDSPRLKMYTSEQAHSSVEKAVIALGLGSRSLVKIPTDSQFRMDTESLRLAVERDLESGCVPFCVSATVGTTSTTSIDPIPAIADICAEHKLWLHVDAAHTGSAAILPEMRWVIAGCDRADSFVMNPHKWLFTPADFSAFYTRHPKILKETFRLVPDYLETDRGDSVRNNMDYGLHLGRRFRSLKLWMVLRYFGVDALRRRIRDHIHLAKMFVSWIEADARFELAAPALLSTVCFRLIGDDSANKCLLKLINDSGKAFLSHTKLHGRFTLRFTVGNLRTCEEDVRAAWSLIQEACDKTLEASLPTHAPAK